MFLGLEPAARALSKDPNAAAAFIQALDSADPNRRVLHEAYFCLASGDAVHARQKLQALCRAAPANLDCAVNLALLENRLGDNVAVRATLRGVLGRSFESWSEGVVERIVELVPAIFYGTQDHALALDWLRLAGQIARKQQKIHENVAFWTAFLEWHENCDTVAAARTVTPFRLTGNPLFVYLDPGNLEHCLLTSLKFERTGKIRQADQMAYSRH